MDWQGRFFEQLSIYGDSAVLTKITGTACPCMSYKDRDSYSEEYHRNNPLAEDCGGTGLIDPGKTTTNINIKFIVSDINTASTFLPKALDIKEVYGEINARDLFIIGTMDTSNSNTSEDLRNLNEYANWITYDSQKYLIRFVTPIPKSVGQIALLKPRN